MDNFCPPRHLWAEWCLYCDFPITVTAECSAWRGYGMTSQASTNVVLSLASAHIQMP